MKTEVKIIDGSEYKVIVAEEGKVFKRIHDGLEIGSEIILGIDYSTGKAREDFPEYYEEVEILITEDSGNFL